MTRRVCFITIFNVTVLIILVGLAASAVIIAAPGRW
jgi:hypothetical protein